MLRNRIWVQSEKLNFQHGVFTEFSWRVRYFVARASVPAVCSKTKSTKVSEVKNILKYKLNIDIIWFIGPKDDIEVLELVSSRLKQKKEVVGVQRLRLKQKMEVIGVQRLKKNICDKQPYSRSIEPPWIRNPDESRLEIQKHKLCSLTNQISYWNKKSWPSLKGRMVLVTDA